MKVRVHCHSKKKVLSVVPMEGPQKGKVVMHAERLMMKSVEFHVSETGRQRVVQSKRKSVHATVVGELEAVWGATPRNDLDNATIMGLAIGKPWRPFDGTAVRYNPYETKTFVTVCDAKPVSRADRLLLDRCKVFAEGLQ